ncbi:MAG: hypothetical protein AB1757_21555 [Acidobacteriota bacterium]
MKEALPIIIFGDSNDEQIIRLKCWLLKCGVCNFAHCRLEDCLRFEKNMQAGLFIISRETMNPTQIEAVSLQARRLAVPVLQL